MPPIQAFNNFQLATGQKVKTPPDQILNDATKNTYMLSRMLKGRGVSDSVQSGTKIIDRIMLVDSGTAVFYQPNDDLNILNPDTLTSISIEWKFLADHYSYTEQEVTLNSGNPQTYYKNLLKAKRQGCMTSLYNKMEEALWDNTTANFALMESTTGKIPYSIPFFVTTDGLAPSGVTTVETVNPSTSSRWQNQTETYDAVDLTDPDNGLVQAFDNMFLKVRFRSPRPGEYFEDDSLQQMMIATSREGRVMWQRLTRDSNDRLVGNDLGGQAGPGLGYGGLPVEYVAELDNAGFSAGQPRYYFLNLKYLHPIFHSSEYMVEKPAMNNPRQPFSWVVWKSTYYNIALTSRRRQGCISAA